MREKIDSYFSRIRSFFWKTNFTPEMVENRHHGTESRANSNSDLPKSIITGGVSSDTKLLLPGGKTEEQPEGGEAKNEQDKQDEQEANRLLERNGKIEDIRAKR